MTKYIDYARAMRSNERTRSPKTLNYKNIFYIILFILLVGSPIGLWIYSKNLPPHFKVNWEEKSVSSNISYQSLPEPYNPPSAPLVLENELSAKEAYVYNPYSFHKLYSKDPDTQVKIASITKLLTALVVIETYDLDDTITVTKDYSYLEWTLGLRKGDKILGWDLFNAMLISSYNDTAYVFADNYPDGWDGFISKMNEKKDILGMSNSKFSNPAGLDYEGNYSTARDLVKLVNAAISSNTISEIVQKKVETITFNRNGGRMSIFAYTTNDLLKSNEYVKGMKTGNTLGAGQCLVTYYDNGKYPFVSILLGSKNRFGDAETIINSID